MAQINGKRRPSENIMDRLPVLPLSTPVFEQVLMWALGRQWHRDEWQPKALLNSYAERARERYCSRDYYVDPVSKAIEAYTSIASAGDMILDSQDDIDRIFGDFTKRTTFVPGEIDIDPHTQTWDEFKRHVSALLLHQELLMRYPEIEAEDKIRSNKYDRE
jgi:hypothetical protein